MNLVIGSDGNIGEGLCNYLSLLREPFIGTSRRNNGKLFLDLSDISSFNIPDVQVAYFCAAMTSLKKCATDPASNTVNVENTISLIQRLVKQNIFVIYLSSNLVFDGEKPNRGEGERHSPKTEYGRQKAKVEESLKGMEGVAIVRCTKVIGRGNVLSSWRESLKKGNIVRPFMDMMISPIPMGIVTYIIHKIGKLKASGIFQISGTEDLSYAEAAYLIAERLNARHLVLPKKSEDVEHVPKYTTLDSSALKRIKALPTPTALEILSSGLV